MFEIREFRPNVAERFGIDPLTTICECLSLVRRNYGVKPFTPSLVRPFQMIFLDLFYKCAEMRCTERMEIDLHSYHKRNLMCCTCNWTEVSVLHMFQKLDPISI